MIVIPMAGRSQRFFDAGYKVPKYELVLGGESVFAHAVGSFAGQFAGERFLFVVAEGAAGFVREEAARLGVADAIVVSLDAPTAGQAETVERGLDAAGVGDGEPLTIFNIDTFRPGYAPPGPWFEGLAGWLEVFRGEGANWSYVRPAEGDDPLAVETAEKRPISDLCCTGLYHFARTDQFRAALAAERAQPQAAELYVAPLYNHLIRQGLKVGYSLIDAADVIFCGTPQEYQSLTSET